jgi:hypothetical protein
MKHAFKAALFLTTLIAITFLVHHGIAFAADAPTPAAAETVKTAIPWWAIATIVAGVVGEILSLIPSLKSNGVVQLVLNILKTVFGKKD